MTSTKRSAIALGAAALMTVSLTACGGSGSGSGASSAPTNASVTDFCTGISGIGTAIDGKSSSSDQANQAHTYATKLEGIGTPTGIPADARSGYEVFVDFLANVTSTEVDTLKGAKDMTSAFSADDLTKVNTFTSYADTTCTPSTTAP